MPRAAAVAPLRGRRGSTRPARRTPSRSRSWWSSVLWLWMIFHLPGGMQGIVSALMIAQRTVGATQRKGLLRLLGGLIGGTLGILVASLAHARA